MALKPAEAVRLKVAAIQEELGRSNADVRWIGAQELHLTLRFYGDLEEAALKRLRQALAQVASSQPRFVMTYSGLGEFPRVVWVGGSQDAGGLAARIESAAGGPPDPYGFTPHLTIGRIRSPRGAKELAAALFLQKEVIVGEDPVREVLLIQSTLRPQGPVYEVLESYPLA